MKVFFFHPFFLIPLIIFFSCDNSKSNYKNFEITIEKKRIDSINFEAKVIVKDNSHKNSKDEIFILIDNEAELNSKIRILKENFLQNKGKSN